MASKVTWFLANIIVVAAAAAAVVTEEAWLEWVTIALVWFGFLTGLAELLGGENVDEPPVSVGIELGLDAVVLGLLVVGAFYATAVAQLASAVTTSVVYRRAHGPSKGGDDT